MLKTVSVLGIQNTAETFSNITITSLTGYMYANNTSPVTASTTIPTSALSGNVAVSNGGTGLTTLNAGYIPYGNGTGAFNSSNGLTYQGSALAIGSYSAGYGVLQVRGGFAYINEDGADTHQLYLRSYLNSAGPGLQVASNDPLLFSTNNTERMRIGATGGVSIGNTTDPGAGNLRFNTTSSNGIYFGSSSQLNDYESGTWSPSVTSASGSITTVGAVSGFYVKVGRAVHLFFNIAITTNGTGSGSILIANIPYIPNATNISQGVFREQSLNGKMGSISIPNLVQIQLQFYDNSYPGSNGTILVGQITYYV